MQSSGQGFNWTTNLNFSAFKTELESLGEGLPYNGLGALAAPSCATTKAHAFGSFFGYMADGLFQTQEELIALNAAAKSGSAAADFYQTSGTAPGDIKFKDMNGDGAINAADRTFIGNPNPDFTYGITNNLTFKGFDLSFFIQGSQGNDVYNLNRYITEGALYGTTNGTTRMLNRWTGPGTSNDVPRAISGDPNTNLRVSTYFIEDGSYARIKNLTLGYTLPASLLSRISATQLRVYVTAQNLATLTKYSGFDPEVSASGVDLGIYPQARVFMAGLNIGF